VGTVRAVDLFTREGLTFDVADTGPAGAAAVVLLHGFPGSARTWDAVAPALAGAGYRVLVPTQRGYSPRARPAGRRAYRVEALVADVLALADQAGLDRFHLVGHDWGGAVAWQLATAHPDRVASLTSLSTPHPRAMLRAMVTSRQALHSWYIAAFQVPRLPEALLMIGGGQRFVAQLQRSGLPPGVARGYAEDLSAPGALTTTRRVRSPVGSIVIDQALAGSSEATRSAHSIRQTPPWSKYAAGSRAENSSGDFNR